MTDFAPVQEKLTAIMTAHTDYAKASFEANKEYFEKLATLKTPDQAMQLSTEPRETDIIKKKLDQIKNKVPKNRL